MTTVLFALACAAVGGLVTKMTEWALDDARKRRIERRWRDDRQRLP